MMTIDALICSVPHCASPLMTLWTPANLKSILIREGFVAIAMDLNTEIMAGVDKDYKNKQLLIDFFYHQKFDNDSIDNVGNTLTNIITRICRPKAKNIFLHLEDYGSQIISRWVCAGIRQVLPNSKIVLIGNGIKKELGTTDLSFPNKLKDQKLIDDYILGDVEDAIVYYMKGQEHKNINGITWDQSSDFNSFPIPNFDDFDLSIYPTKTLPIVDVRGCIKSCEFCNVVEHWNSFQYRTADIIFAEMMHHVEKYDVKTFEFITKVTNGNLKEFKKLVKLMAEYNDSKAKKDQLSWSGHFIIRDPKSHPEELWRDISRSNARLLLGVEGLNEKIRMSMQHRSFTNADLDYHLDMGKKYYIPMAIRFTLAYPTETLEDYDNTRNWFRDSKRYANSPLHTVELVLMGIHSGTQLQKKTDQLNLKTSKYPSVWINQTLNITPTQRKNLILDLKKICEEEWGINAVINEQELWTIDNIKIN